MPSNKTVLKSVTPDSVKVLMIIEAIAIVFFSFWLANEYIYNAYFRVYVDNVFVQHLTSYTIAIGLGIGLAGAAVAATLYKTMHEAKVKLEIVAPKIRGSVEKLLATVQSIDVKSPSPVSSPGMIAAQTETPSTSSAPHTPISAPKNTEEKK